MKISRRNFLKGSATTLFLAGFNFPVLANADKKKNLVIIMLRGGMDGLCAVPIICLLYTSPSPRDDQTSRMPSSA